MSEGSKAWTDDERRIGDLLLATWQEKEPRHGVSLHPESYRATFFDMARAVLSAAPGATPAPAAGLVPLTDEQIEKAIEAWFAQASVAGCTHDYQARMRAAFAAAGLTAPKGDA